jgi:hypothetical protein
MSPAKAEDSRMRLDLFGLSEDFGLLPWAADNKKARRISADGL